MNYNGLIKFDTGNCHGISTTLFVSGCANHCIGCHNPQTWDCNYGIVFDDNAKKEFFNSISNPHISHVVFSGGDPLFPKNRETICNICADIRNLFPEKKIVIYTGYTIESLLKTYDNTVDLILKNSHYLIEGPFIQAQKVKGLDLRGSYNQRCFLIQTSDAPAFKMIDWSSQYFKDVTERDQLNLGKKIYVNAPII